jgi:hypothetical protein
VTEEDEGGGAAAGESFGGEGGVLHHTFGTEIKHTPWTEAGCNVLASPGEGSTRAGSRNTSKSLSSNLGCPRSYDKRDSY